MTTAKPKTHYATNTRSIVSFKGTLTDGCYRIHTDTLTAVYGKSWLYEPYVNKAFVMSYEECGDTVERVAIREEGLAEIQLGLRRHEAAEIQKLKQATPPF